MGLMALILGAAACNKRPKGVLDDDKMVDVMTDLELAEAYYVTNSSPQNHLTREILQASVLKKHGVTQEEMDSTIAYYGRNMDDYYKLYAKVEERLGKHSRNGETETNEVLNDVWPYAGYTLISQNQATDGIIFSIPMSSLEKGSSVEWGMRLSAPDGVETTFGVEYENGISTMLKRAAGGNKSMKILIQTDTAYKVKRVFGSLSVPTERMPLWVDSIQLVTMPYDSINYSRIRQQKTIRPPYPKTAEKDTAANDSVKINETIL